MRCQHCYSDIREARITEYAAADLVEGKPMPSVWMSEHGSPFCLRALCESESHPDTWHEVKHEPMPAV